ncbi:MAG: hypothetical protein H0U03_05400 [Actinobacteria bacterium]|nr:hypothetical protein [Actinomycetota bacterium]
MAEPARTLRDLTERFGLAAFGAAVLTAERADRLAEELARRGNVTQQEARELIDETMQRWRGGTAQIGERAGSGLTGILRELGLVTRNEYEELELRIAQLEHRLRLVEDRGPA